MLDIDCGTLLLSMEVAQSRPTSSVGVEGDGNLLETACKVMKYLAVIDFEVIHARTHAMFRRRRFVIFARGWMACLRIIRPGTVRFTALISRQNQRKPGREGERPGEVRAWGGEAKNRCLLVIRSCTVGPAG